MKTRILTAVVALPLFVAFIYFGGAPLYVLFTVMSCIGLYEFHRAYKIEDRILLGLAMGASGCYYLLLFLFSNRYFGAVLALYLLILLVCFVIRFPKIKFESITLSFVAFIYVTYLFSHIVLLREEKLFGGIWLVWLVFLIAFGSDTFAYFTGRLFGKHKLAKLLSPNKTIEGAVGGVAAATLLSMGYGIILSNQHVMGSEFHPILFAVLGAVGSVLSQLGDLAASAIKRQTAIKDFGKLLPGHGGVIDRFDSNIFTAPFVYYVMRLWLDVMHRL